MTTLSDRLTWIKRTIAALRRLLSGERVDGLTLADMGTADEARDTLYILSRELRASSSLPLSPVWIGGAA